MTDRTSLPRVEWTQPSLFPQDVLELVWRVGVVRSEEHVQVQLEVIDRGSGELVSLRSWPHLDARNVDKVLGLIDDYLRDEVRNLCGPFA